MAELWKEVIFHGNVWKTKWKQLKALSVKVYRTCSATFSVNTWRRGAASRAAASRQT